MVWRPQPETLPFVRYFHPPLNDHWVTSGRVGPGYAIEAPLGALFMVPNPGTHPLYGCAVGGDHFVSLVANCEGNTTLGVNGCIYDAAPGPTARLLYRCHTGADHFVSTDPGCEGHHVEASLGWVP